MMLNANHDTTKDLLENNGRHTTTFRFPAQWNAWKYDDDEDPDNRFFKSQVQTASGLSAVDFVAHDANSDTLLLIECKDIRDATPENLPRLADAPSADESEVGKYIKKNKFAVTVQRAKPYLPREFAKNIRDTLVGLAGASRANDPALHAFAGLLHAGKKLVCVLSFEMDTDPNWQPNEGGRLLSRLKAAIEREISFLQNVEVVICSQLYSTPSHHYKWQIVVSP